MAAEGVEFVTNAHIGVNVPLETLRKDFNAIVLAMGAEHPRDLNVPGRELKGIHFAMDFLPQQNKRGYGDEVPDQILATGKRVVIIGGGDTGADCLGTSHRQKAASVHQFEIMPMPPAERSPSTPWPLWPLQLRMESSHEEGGQREWAVATTHFTGDADGNVKQLHGIRVTPAPKFDPIPGTEFTHGRGSGAAGDGIHGSGEARAGGTVGREARRARECRGERAGLADFASRRVRGGRRAARAVAGGVGDRRGAQGRRGGGSIPARKAKYKASARL